MKEITLEEIRAKWKANGQKAWKGKSKKERSRIMKERARVRLERQGKLSTGYPLKKKRSSL